jgi:hypothetical protein
MAKALECPACGAKHRLDGLEPSMTFRCERCGQTLKVPASLAAARADADPKPTASSTTRPGATSGAGTVAPPPRRRTSGSAPAREVVGVSATLAASSHDDGTMDGSGNGQPSTAAPRTRGTGASRRRVHWYWRALAWVVAVPVGFLITAWPAYEFGLLKKDDVLDVFVGSGSGRYTGLAIGTLIWALVTALLVQLFIEGGRVWADRRRRRRDSGALRGASASG